MNVDQSNEYSPCELFRILIVMSFEIASGPQMREWIKQRLDLSQCLFDLVDHLVFGCSCENHKKIEYGYSDAVDTDIEQKIQLLISLGAQFDIPYGGLDGNGLTAWQIVSDKELDRFGEYDIDICDFPQLQYILCHLIRKKIVKKLVTIYLSIKEYCKQFTYGIPNDLCKVISIYGVVAEYREESTIIDWRREKYTILTPEQYCLSEIFMIYINPFPFFLQCDEYIKSCMYPQNDINMYTEFRLRLRKWIEEKLNQNHHISKYDVLKGFFETWKEYGPSNIYFRGEVGRALKVLASKSKGYFHDDIYEYGKEKILVETGYKRQKIEIIDPLPHQQKITWCTVEDE